LPGLAEALLLVFAPVKRLAQFLVGGLSVNKKKEIYIYNIMFPLGLGILPQRDSFPEQISEDNSYT
jgi:hypothetical protein